MSKASILRGAHQPRILLFPAIRSVLYIADFKCKGIRQMRVRYCPRLKRWTVVAVVATGARPGAIIFSPRFGGVRLAMRLAEQLAGCPLNFVEQ